jgi:capsular polysaccharide biosynthesis protein
MQPLPAEGVEPDNSEEARKQPGAGGRIAPTLADWVVDLLYDLPNREANNTVTARGGETSRSLEHASSVIRRWWVLIFIGTMVAVSLGAAVSVGSSTHFTADAQVLFIQPGQALRPGDSGALNRLAQLMSTVSQLATSDSVLDVARQRAAVDKPPRTLNDLRSRVSASGVSGSLILTIHTDFPTAAEAQQVAAAMIDQLKVRLGQLANSKSDPITTLTLEDVRAPVVTKVGSTLARTLLVSFVLGAGFSVLAAFALDRA